MRHLVRVVPTIAALLVGAASFVLSFVALRDVSSDVGAVPADLAWLVPLVVDGGVLAGSASLWSASYRQCRRDPIAYATVAGLLAFSVVVNVNHAGPSLLAKCIAALPPVVLLACLELVAAEYRRDRGVRAPLPAPAKLPPTTARDVEIDRAPADQSVFVGAVQESKADRVRAKYDELVLSGMDPRDPSIVRLISGDVGVADAYVRRLIRPTRGSRVRAEAPATGA